LASGSASGEVKVWDVASGKEIGSYRGHAGEIAALALSPDGHWAASAHVPKEFSDALLRGQVITVPYPPIKVWDATTGQERFTLSGHPSFIDQVAFSPDGRLLASAGYQLVKIWDVATGTVLRELKGKELRTAGAHDFLAFSPAGDLLITAGDKTAQLWNVSSGRSLGVFQGHLSPNVHGLALSPDQSRLATAGNREVKLWDVKSGQEILLLTLPELPADTRGSARVVALAWTAEGQRLRAGLQDGTVVEWDAMAKPVPRLATTSN
jgi:WD40 repeat protein